MEYYVNVKPYKGDDNDGSQECNNTGNNFSLEESLNAMKKEYDYCLHSSQKIDTKVQIVVTICAVFFAGMLTFMNDLPKVDLPKTYERLYLILLFYMLLLIQFGLKLYILYAVVTLIKGVEVKRIEQSNILSDMLIKKDRVFVCQYLCECYDECIQNNKDVLQNRFKKLNFILNFLIVDFGVMAACAIMRVIMF